MSLMLTNKNGNTKISIQIYFQVIQWDLLMFTASQYIHINEYRSVFICDINVLHVNVKILNKTTAVDVTGFLFGIRF